MVALALSSSCPSPPRFVGKQVAARSSRNSSTASIRSAAAVSSDAVVSEERLQVCKSGSQSNEAPEPVDEARAWAEFLTRAEARGPGDYGNAMERVERRYRLPSRLLWTLRYRPPKDMFVKIHRSLKAAYEAERQRQMRLLSHDNSITRLTTGPDHPAVRAAEALLGAHHE